MAGRRCGTRENRGNGGAAGARKAEKRWRGGGTRGGDAGSREMAGRRCGTRENRGNGGAAGGAVATGQSGAGWTARNETRGCGEGAKARAGIWAYPNGMSACRLDMNARPAGEILWFVCRARTHGKPPPGTGGVWGRYARRAARTEPPAGGGGRLGALCPPRRAHGKPPPGTGVYVGSTAPHLPRPPRPHARKTPAGDGGRLGALCLPRRAHGKPPPGAGGALGAPRRTCRARRARRARAAPVPCPRRARAAPVPCPRAR